MKKVLLALALIAFSSPVYSYDDKFDWQIWATKCDEVIEAHASFKNKEKNYIGSHLTARVIGYIAGYITAKNKWKAGKDDWFKGKQPRHLLPWTASYCRSNPSHNLHQALESFSGN